MPLDSNLKYCLEAREQQPLGVDVRGRLRSAEGGALGQKEVDEPLLF